jgi:hypothetical protein
MLNRIIFVLTATILSDFSRTQQENQQTHDQFAQEDSIVNG